MTVNQKNIAVRSLNESFSKPNDSHNGAKDQTGRDSVQRSISNGSGKDSAAPQGNFKPAAGVKVKR